MAFFRTVILVSVIFGGVAVLFSFEPFTTYRNQLYELLPYSIKEHISETIAAWSSIKNVITKEDLSRYTGSDGSPGLYLAILGKVYDVAKGERFYGPGKGYGFFAGKDGSRAFVTGEFTDKGLTDDLDGLTNAQLHEIQNWAEFYERDYVYIGVLEGNFYDSNGRPTKFLYEFYDGVIQAEAEKQKLKEDQKVFPSCNSEWIQDSGSRVWCSKKSGGIERHWVGVPRQYHKPGASSTRCACVRTKGPPFDEPDKDSDNGDVDNPNLKLYPGCDKASHSCAIIK